MNYCFRLLCVCVVFFSVPLCFVRAANSQPIDTIDRPVVIYVAGTAGGGIDLFARLVGRHLGRHIPGNPTVTVQDVPGAGGIRAAYQVANTAPRDGTALVTFASGPILEPLIGARNPGYDMSQFTWIGAVTKDVSVCLSRGTTRFKTIDDVRNQEMIIAGTGAGSDTNIWAIIINNLLGTKFKLVSGYPGTQETILAIERGEVQGRIISLSALRTAKPDWLRDGKTSFLLQLALEKSSELPDVPLIFEFLTKEEDRQMISLLVGPSAMSRPFAAPPGLSPGKATLLRRAFDATMKDAEFLAEAARIQADIKPTAGEDVQKIVARMYATPRAVIERIKKFYVQ